ncbi:uncharacterized protein LOC127834794 [Dreissena polymorpha]|uniref:Sodefrin-like factor n=1 Tax=Dreissena polymorpha TaxID=45954 RepID=A0A9D4FW76_DREPO|nr:uncharacterized protein LOC127834794 [Dreissena polymorpha]KAH3804734.1 hypothetical protein DPMN_133022 [Dreissena polymorpha]
MNTHKQLAIWITFFLIGVFALEIPPEYQLKCRLCNNALELRDCTKQEICDNRTEECYMEQVITDAFTIQYRGGCKSSTHCNGGTAVATGKRDEGIVCSQCCGYANDCNSRLCGIRQGNITASQCYFCDDSKSDQASVSRPEDCITFTNCDTDQVCSAHDEYHPGSHMTYRYGCMNKAICKTLTRVLFRDMEHCLNRTSLECNHESVMCDVCCGDTGCNYGACKEIKERLFRLYKSGHYNMTTLQTT